MTKRTIAKIPISPGTPVRVEDFRYVDQGLEWNMQNEFELRDDHLQASRVVNWEVFGEAALGLDGWTPGDSLLLTVTANELFTTEGLAYIGGRSYVLSADAELFDGETPATDTYNIYLKYTLASDEFAYEYTTSTRSDDHTIKYLLIGTAVYTTAVGWSSPVDKRASNTALGAPATVSGSDSGPIFTVENTGSGLGLLVRLSDAQIGEDGTPQILTIWGTSTTGLTLKESGTANSIVLSCDATGRMKVAGAINVTGTGTVGGVTLNAGAVSGITTLDMSGALTGGTWEGTVVANAYVANDITLDNLTQITISDHADLTVGIGTKSHSTIDTHIDATNIHYLQSAITTVGTIGAGSWQGTQINSTYLVDVSQPLHSGSSPTFVGLTLSGTIATPTTITTTGKITSGTDVQVGSNNIKDSGGVTRITLGTTITLDGDIVIGGDDIKDSDSVVRISFDASDGIDFIGPFICDLDPGVITKLYDMGTSGMAWDECYADNWNNVSSWKPYADPLTTIAKFRHLPDDVYETDYDNLDDWVRARVKCNVKDAKGKLKWEGGYVIKSGYEKAGVREVYDEKLKKNVKVGNYADGYNDEDFEHEKAYSLNKAQVVLIQAVGQLKDARDNLITKVAELESRILTLESAS